MGAGTLKQTPQDMPQTKALPRTAVPSDVSYQGEVIRVDPDDAQIRDCPVLSWATDLSISKNS